MKLSTLLLFTILALYSCQAQLTKKQSDEAYEILGNLMKQDAMKETLEAVQLTLSTSTDRSAYDMVMEILNDQLETLKTQLAEDTEFLNNLQNSCDEKLSHLMDRIKERRKHAYEQKKLLPPLEEQLESKEEQVRLQKAETDTANDDIINLDRNHEEKAEEYQQRSEGRDKMIAGLMEARALMMTMTDSAASFLQVKDKSSFLNQIQKKSMEITNTKLQHRHHRGMFKQIQTLMEIAAKSEDGAKVDKVIAIIDELVSYEQETKTLEFQQEQNRIDRYNFNRLRLENVLSVLQLKLNDANYSYNKIQKEIDLINQELNDIAQAVNELMSQYDQESTICDTEINAYKTNVRNYDNDVDLMRRLIILVDGSSLQALKNIQAMLDEEDYYK